MIRKALAPRVHWDLVQGWVVDTRFPLDAAMLLKCVQFTRKMQRDRILGLPPGDRREQMTKALASLSVATLQVNLMTADPIGDERILY